MRTPRARIESRQVDLSSCARVRQAQGSRKTPCYQGIMINSNSAPGALSNDDLLAATRELVRRACDVEAELLVHLGEIDERRIYLDLAFPSMFAFSIGELGFSEDAAYYRITVARAGRRWPAVIDALRSGQVHLGGLRLLVPHLTDENQREVLAQAAGKSKRQIEELVARLAPLPAVPDLIRKLPERPTSAPARPALTLAAPSAPLPRREEHRPIIAPLTEETFKIQFTGTRSLRDKLREAQDLLRHRVPDGDLATVIERAVDLLIEEVKKGRFAAGRKARQKPKESREDAAESSSRHIPDAIKRAVFERDEGRCTFADERGRRCAETGGLEFDHLDAFARTHLHEVDRIRLTCRGHNQHAADKIYGRAFMERARAERDPTRPGASPHPRLL